MISENALHELSPVHPPDDNRVPLAEFTLEVLWWAQAAEASVDHDGQTSAQGLTLLHAGGGNNISYLYSRVH